MFDLVTVPLFRVRNEPIGLFAESFQSNQNREIGEEDRVNSAACYRVNAPKVVHDVIEGEAVLINLYNGDYYSIGKVGADVWNLVEKGVAVPEIVHLIANLYEGDRGEIEKGIHELLAELQREELIVPDTAAKPYDGNDLHAANGAADGKPVFEQPRLHKYSDMEDLLLLDPIHDVDETGWPNVPLDKN